MPIGVAGDSPGISSANPDNVTFATAPRIIYNLPDAGSYTFISAALDNAAATNVVMQSPALLNSNGTFDRLRGEGGRLLLASDDMLTSILVELRTISQLLVEGLNITTDPDAWRGDPSLNPTTPGSVN